MAKDLFGSVAKGMPPASTGKTFFVSDTSGASWNELNLRYPPDADGVARVHTSVTLALAQCTSGNGDVVILAPDFTTALTAAEILSAETKGVTVLPAGKNSDGVWFSERATATPPQSANSALFTITGKIKVISLVGEVMTDVQDQACDFTLSHQNDGNNNSATALASVALAAATNIQSEPIGTLIGLTGTFANSLVTSHSAAAIQANPFVVRKGSIKLQTSASNTGSIKWRIDYIPLEPGARAVAA